MQRNHFLTTIKMTTVFILVVATGAWASDTETVLYSFGLNVSGVSPRGALIQDSAGNLYGTTAAGGGPPCGCGTVFELSPSSGGEWTYTTLYSFLGANGGADFPEPSGLVLDARGNLYGTAFQAGIVNSNCSQGCGFVYELSPASGGGWTFNTLYSFQGSNDGRFPSGPLVFDVAGNLYGVTDLGGLGGGGTVFKLSPGSGGAWRESVVYFFLGKDDGAGPNAVIFDASGNLYGMAGGNGKFGFGTVFELSPNSSGKGWSFKLLHSFAGVADGDGRFPLGPLIFDKAGNLYGTTIEGGNAACGGGGGCGTVFVLKPTPTGWRERVLHSFDGPDGLDPLAGLAEDAAGNLYGTTSSGGGSVCGDCGTVFELSRRSGGWEFATLYDFTGGNDGQDPGGLLFAGTRGEVYGMAQGGGSLGGGVAFELFP